MSDPAVDQLADALDVALAAPVASLLGLDVATTLRHRIAERAPLLAAQLRDAALADATAVDVLTAMWGHADPNPAWWRTPVGRLCAAALVGSDTEEVTHAVAAAMLGVTRGTIAQLVSRGTLDRHPDGGVLRASVLQRLSR